MQTHPSPSIEDLISQIKERLSLPDQSIERPMDEAETSIFAKWSRRSLQRGRQTGEGPPYHRLGKRRVVYYPSEVLAWLNSRRHLSTTAEGYKRKRAA